MRCSMLRSRSGSGFRYTTPSTCRVRRPIRSPGSSALRERAKWSPAGGNWGHYFNENVEALVGKVSETFDEAERDKLITRVHEIMVEDAAMLFVTHDLNPRALSPRLSGFVQAQSWLQDLTPIVVRSKTTN